jgi:putative two-component system response regulator
MMQNAVSSLLSGLGRSHAAARHGRGLPLWSRRLAAGVPGENSGQTHFSREVTVDNIVKVLELAMAARDPYTVAHQQNVAHLAAAIAGEMGLEEKQKRNLMTAARIHDFGKFAVPAGILMKPGELSNLEMAMIKSHPGVGAELLKPLLLPPVISMAIMQHHERLDGSGYPFGLSGEDILLEARILAVADTLDAMASHRPYRPSLGIEMALEEVSRTRGVLYDPEVVDAVMKIYPDHRLSCSWALVA